VATIKTATDGQVIRKGTGCIDLPHGEAGHITATGRSPPRCSRGTERRACTDETDKVFDPYDEPPDRERAVGVDHK